MNEEMDNAAAKKGQEGLDATGRSEGGSEICSAGSRAGAWIGNSAISI